MKIIFSRKGYDSAAGGIPSPIFEDGSLCSLPIPSKQSPRLGAIRFGETNLGRIAGQLKNDRGVGAGGVHLDPDLNKSAVPRKNGWRPCFGQEGAAQTHLDKHQIGEGDLFLFFGWFREVEIVGGKWRYRRKSPDMHCVFGWLQIGKIYHPGMGGMEPPNWALDHPHVKYAEDYANGSGNNALYVAAEILLIPGWKRRMPGGGVFRTFAQSRCLTEPGGNRSVWRLSLGFYPTKGRPPLSYHSDMRRWTRDQKGVLLNTVGRGQEFVLDCDYYPEAINWLHRVFEDVPNPGRTPQTTRRT